VKSAIFDLETTGLLMPAVAPLEQQPRIIELGLVTISQKPGKQRKVERHNWLIWPGRDITEEITKITGISNDDLKGKPQLHEVIEEIADAFAGTAIAYAHNMPFDSGVLKAELQRIGYAKPILPAELVCTVQEHAHMFGHRPKLIDLYLKIIGKELAQTHRASDDAYALYEVLEQEGLL
jgi:DNA polymerase III epsilon subunit-like protein